MIWSTLKTAIWSHGFMQHLCPPLSSLLDLTQHFLTIILSILILCWKYKAKKKYNRFTRQRPHTLVNCRKACRALPVLSRFSSVCLFETLWTIGCQPPLSMGFSRQEYWSGLPCPPPGDLPDPGIESRSPEVTAS